MESSEVVKGSVAAAPPSDFGIDLVSRIGVRLGEGGFKRREAGIYTKELSSDVLGWVGIHLTGKKADGLLYVDPIVGIRHQQIEAKWAKLLGEKPHPYLLPTLSTNAGFLGPRREHKEWGFEEGRDNTSIIARLARFVLSTGLQFMKETASLNKILERTDMMVPDSVLFRVPIIHWLTGDEEQVRVTLRGEIANTRKRKDKTIEQYRVFAKKLMGELE
ncbi:MAG: hypothetical protein H6Q89_4002 [Myxococcaceae bacterium]|nr:hypothetical protein [Myxococcaceae bacterium]